MKLFSPAKHGGLEDPGNKIYKAQKTSETKVTRSLPRVLQGMWYDYQGMDRLNSWQIEGVSRMQSSRVLSCTQVGFLVMQLPLTHNASLTLHPYS